jgi:signal transduction histidine kinase
MHGIMKDNREKFNTGSWMRWHKISYHASENDLIFLLSLRLRIFKSLTLVASFFLLLVVVVQIFTCDDFPLADFGNLCAFIILNFIVHKKPEFLHACSWLALFALLTNMIDGFFPFQPGVIRPAYLLWPLLVLFGVLLGDIWISLTAFLFVSAAFTIIAVLNYPLSTEDLMILANLYILIVASSYASWAIWRQYRTLIAIIQAQSSEIRHELDLKMRLNAIIFHDLNSPLAMLKGVTQLAEMKGNCDQDDFEMLEKTAERFSSIIRSAKTLDVGTELLLSKVKPIEIFNDLKEMFIFMKKNKKLFFEFKNPGGEELFIMGHKEILVNSVFQNFLSNAVKFAEPESVIEMKCIKEEDGVRLSIINKGSGFSKNILESVWTGKRYKSEPSTDGEVGSGKGLLIASMCLRNMGAVLEVRNLEREAELSAFFPFNKKNGVNDE